MSRMLSQLARRGVALAMVTLLLVPGGMQVLCIGDDGHVAVELPHTDGGCDQDMPRSDEGVRVTDASDCTDYTLAPPPTVRVEREAAADLCLPATPVLYTLIEPVAQLAPITVGRAAGASAMEGEPGITLRSTILLV